MAWIHTNLAVIFRNAKYKNLQGRIDLLQKLGVHFRVEYSAVTTLIEYCSEHKSEPKYILDFPDDSEEDCFVFNPYTGCVYRNTFDCSQDFDTFFESVVQYEVDDVVNIDLPKPERIDFPDLGVTLIRRTFDIKNH